MTRRRGPTRRLLIVPVLLFVALVVGLQAFESTTRRPADPALDLSTALPPVAGPEQACVRGGRDELPDVTGALGGVLRVTSRMVLACPMAFDGMRVRYIGEVVGDLLRRDGGAWVLVNDDDYGLEVGPLPAHGDHRGTNGGLTVWVPEHLLERLAGLGRPNQRGDVVDVRGPIVRTDPRDAGGLTLHVETLQVLAPAVAVPRPVDVAQFWLAVAANLVAASLWAVRRRASSA